MREALRAAGPARSRTLVLVCLGLATLTAGYCACRAEPDEFRPPLAAPPPTRPVGEPDSTAAADLHVPAAFATTWTFVLRDHVEGEPSLGSCSGGLSIARQEGPAFHGTFRIAAGPGCSAADSGHVQGTVFRYGDLVFDLRVAGRSVNELASLADCRYVGPASRFHGAVHDKKLVALGTATMACAAAGGTRAFDLRVLIDARRTSPVHQPERPEVARR